MTKRIISDIFSFFNFTRTTLIFFLALTFITIYDNIINYSKYNILLIFLATLSNAILYLLVIQVNRIFISMKEYRITRIFHLAFCLLLVFFFGEYFLSTIIHMQYGTFLTFSGYLYAIATLTFTKRILLWLIIALFILIIGVSFFSVSRKESHEKNNKRILMILAGLFILIVIIYLTPREIAHETSPIFDLFKRLIKNIPYAYTPIENSTIRPEILKISTIKNPNVVLIMLESVSAEHISYYGYKRNITPNIDSLAEKGIVFQNAFSTASHSDYAQPSFLSSHYTLTDELRADLTMSYPRDYIWNPFKEEKNYSVAFISSQNELWVGMLDSYYPKRNFDLLWFSMTDGNWSYGSDNARKDYDEITIAKAIEWINSTTMPFFAYINLQATHYPYEYPKNNSVFLPDNLEASNYFKYPDEEYEENLNRYDNALYYADRQIGILLNFLKQKNLTNDTIIILTADHGEIIENRHGNIRHGFGVYNEEVRVPLIFVVPKARHLNITENVKHIDVAPTILKLANISIPRFFQGTVMRKGSDIFFLNQNQNFNIGMLRDDIKFIIDMNTYIFKAYNLTADPYELNNLIKDEDSEIYYTEKYGYPLFKWYNCQISYYENRRWEFNERIDC